MTVINLYSIAGANRNVFVLLLFQLNLAALWLAIVFQSVSFVAIIGPFLFALYCVIMGGTLADKFLKSPRACTALITVSILYGLTVSLIAFTQGVERWYTAVTLSIIPNVVVFAYTKKGDLGELRLHSKSARQVVQFVFVVLLIAVLSLQGGRQNLTPTEYVMFRVSEVEGQVTYEAIGTVINVDDTRLLLLARNRQVVDIMNDDVLLRKVCAEDFFLTDAIKASTTSCPDSMSATNYPDIPYTVR